jgi:leader peptidase (prepilin peptidase)/N-methyltransferase
MLAMWPLLAALGIGFFMIGTVVGSFLNVCIYRIPWQKSVIWPSSRCPRCLSGIAARDNIPIVSWIALRGECRECGLPIAARYPLVEALVGLLFLGVYLVDMVAAPGVFPTFQLVVAAYHAVFLALLVVATFIDYDFLVIPRSITVIGIIIGVGLGTLFPSIRPVPMTAATHWQGFWVGFWGLVAGSVVVRGVRLASGLVLGLLRFMKRTEIEEAMGLGDVDLLAMIGAFMGWRAAVLTFFLAPFFGLAHAAWKMIHNLEKKSAGGGQLSIADHEMPFGPYLSMAAATLLLVWPWIWSGWASKLFGSLYVIFWWMLGIYVDEPI